MACVLARATRQKKTQTPERGHEQYVLIYAAILVIGPVAGIWVRFADLLEIEVLAATSLVGRRGTRKRTKNKGSMIAINLHAPELQSLDQKGWHC